MLQWFREAFDDWLMGFLGTLKEVDRFAGVGDRLHSLFHGDCGKSAVFCKDVQEIFCVADIEPRLFFAFDFVELGDVEIDANPSVTQANYADSELSEIVLRTCCNQDITVASLYVDDVVCQLAKFENEWTVFEVEVGEE